MYPTRWLMLRTTFDIVQVWDASTGGNDFQYNGSGSEVFAAAWSPDGTRIASGGTDTTVQIWRPE